MKKGIKLSILAVIGALVLPACANKLGNSKIKVPSDVVFDDSIQTNMPHPLPPNCYKPGELSRC